MTKIPTRKERDLDNSPPWAAMGYVRDALGLPEDAWGDDIIDAVVALVERAEAHDEHGICNTNRRPCDENQRALLAAQRRIEDGTRREMALEAEVARLRDAGAVDPKQVERLKRNLAEALEEVRTMREGRREAGQDAGKWLRDLEIESDLEKALDEKWAAIKQLDEARTEIARLHREADDRAHDAHQAAFDEVVQERQEARAEVERLRAELGAAVDETVNLARSGERARQENERLRAMVGDVDADAAAHVAEREAEEMRALAWEWCFMADGWREACQSEGDICKAKIEREQRSKIDGIVRERRRGSIAVARMDSKRRRQVREALGLDDNDDLPWQKHLAMVASAVARSKSGQVLANTALEALDDVRHEVDVLRELAWQWCIKAAQARDALAIAVENITMLRHAAAVRATDEHQAAADAGDQPRLTVSVVDMIDQAIAWGRGDDHEPVAQGNESDENSGERAADAVIMSRDDKPESE